MLGAYIVALFASASLVAVDVSPDRTNAIYACGERARLTVTVIDKASGRKHDAGCLRFRLDDFGSVVVSEGEVDLARSNPFELSGTLEKSGVLRLKVSAKDGAFAVEPRAGQYDWAWGAAFGVSELKPTQPCPADFAAFWKNARANLDRTVPVDPQMTEVQSMETGTARFYRISVASYKRRVHGLMSIPKSSEGPLPVWVYVPGAGCADWSNYIPELGSPAINVMLSVFPWDVGWENGGRETMVKYKAMMAEIKAKWGVDNYGQAGLVAAAREDYFFYPVILGCVRALECLAAMPQVDSRRMYYYGSSQGGGLGIALTALFGRFAAAGCMVPAFCDLDAESAGRQGDWPIGGMGKAFREKAKANACYFDACNFSRFIKTPVTYEAGGGDCVNPPHCVLAAYAVCPSAGKRLVFIPAQGHDASGEACRQVQAWIGSHRLDRLPRIRSGVCFRVNQSQQQ